MNKTLIASTLGMLLIGGNVQAAGTHDSGAMDHSTMGQQASQNQMFLEKRNIDGYTVTFHIMPATEGMDHGGSHNLMVKVEQQGKALTSLQANTKVVYPGGKDESKALMKMGSWFMVGYDLESKGDHQVMVLFKTPDGKKHFGGVHYSGR